MAQGFALTAEDGGTEPKPEGSVGRGGVHPQPKANEPKSNEPRPVEPKIDPRLLEQARKGDREALRRLLEPELDRLYTVCVRMLGPRRHEDARDTCHDAVVSMIRGISGFDGRSSFGTWATRVAMNACLSRLRTEKRRSGGAAGGGVGGRSGSGADPDSVEHRGAWGVQEDGPAEDLRGRVARGLEEISPDQRALLVLRDVRGLEYAAIGSVLGLPLGTVKSRLFRARAALREALERDGGEASDSGFKGSGLDQSDAGVSGEVQR